MGSHLSVSEFNPLALTFNPIMTFQFRLWSVDKKCVGTELKCLRLFHTERDDLLVMF